MRVYVGGHIYVWVCTCPACALWSQETERFSSSTLWDLRSKCRPSPLSSNLRKLFHLESSIQHPYFLLQRYLPMTWDLDPFSHANYFCYVCSSSLSVWDSLPSNFSPLFTDFNLTLLQQSIPWPSLKGTPDFPCFSPSSMELALQDFPLCFLSTIIFLCLLLLTLPNFFKLGFSCWLLFYIQKNIKTIHDWVWLHSNKWVLGIQSIFSPF